VILQITLSGAGLIAGDYEVQRILAIVASIISFILFFISIPALVGGIGILKMRSWARILLLAYSFISLLNIPFGTVLAIFTIKLMLDRETIELLNDENKEVVADSRDTEEEPWTRSEPVSTGEEEDDIVS